MDLDAYLSRPNSESMAEFARRLCLNADQVRQWRHRHEGRRPSPGNSAEIERATAGGVTCEELRPDIVWHRVADEAWPWHRKGRPTVDLTRSEQAEPTEAARA